MRRFDAQRITAGHCPVRPATKHFQTIKSWTTTTCVSVCVCVLGKKVEKKTGSEKKGKEKANGCRRRCRKKMDQSKVATVTTRRRHWSTTFSSSRTRTRRNETKIKTIIIKKKPVTPRLNRIPNIEKAHRPDEQKQSKRKRKKGGRMENKKKNEKKIFVSYRFFLFFLGKTTAFVHCLHFAGPQIQLGRWKLKDHCPRFRLPSIRRKIKAK